jgi:hypothetical protein
LFFNALEIIAAPVWAFVSNNYNKQKVKFEISFHILQQGSGFIFPVSPTALLFHQGVTKAPFFQVSWWY